MNGKFVKDLPIDNILVRNDYVPTDPLDLATKTWVEGLFTSSKFNNGLTVTSGVVQLGGSLIKHTNIDGAFNFRIGEITQPPIISLRSTSLRFNNLIWPLVDGTANQVLKTDGAGNLSWTTVSGGGLVNLIDSGSNVISSGTGTGYFQWKDLRLDNTLIRTYNGNTLNISAGLVGDSPATFRIERLSNVGKEFYLDDFLVKKVSSGIINLVGNTANVDNIVYFNAKNSNDTTQSLGYFQSSVVSGVLRQIFLVNNLMAVNWGDSTPNRVTINQGSKSSSIPTIFGIDGSGSVGVNNFVQGASFYFYKPNHLTTTDSRIEAWIARGTASPNPLVKVFTILHNEVNFNSNKITNISAIETTSFPTSNPGAGKLWSNGGVITMGT